MFCYSLCSQIESLEARCEELQKSLDEMTVAQEAARRRKRKSVCTPDEPDTPHGVGHNSEENVDKLSLNKLPLQHVNSSSDDEEVTQLLQQLQEVRSQRAKEQRKIQDLEEQVSSLIQV